MQHIYQGAQGRYMAQGIESQRGVKHVGLIIIAGLFILGGGLLAWRYLSPESSSQNAPKASACGYPDDDLCKFFTKWKALKSYRMVSSSTDIASNSRSTITMDIDGDNSHVVIGGPSAHELIIIGNKTTYTKAPNGVWWKQEASAQQENAIADAEGKPEFQEPSKDPKVTDTSYTLIGKVACGTLTCFKYQVFDPASPTDTGYIWFDTKDYLIRRSTMDSESFTTDATFSYDNVSVTAPTGFKTLNSNQTLMPGQNEPTTLQTAQ
jgi:hypothetical protein